MQENMVWRDWLTRRKITDAVIDEFGVSWGNHVVIGECIVIPVHDMKGNFLFNKYRRNPLFDVRPKYVYDKGGKVSLYGLHLIKDVKKILITEGEMDSLVAWSAHIPAVTSTGGALSFQKEWAEYFTDKEIVVCFDNDKTGGEGMVKMLDIIPHAQILFLPDRPGIKDISDYSASGGDLVELMRTAVRFTCLQDIIDHRAKRLSLWQSTFFHDAYIEEHTKPEHVSTYVHPIGEEVTDLLLRAKQYPISRLLKFDKNGKANCIWHNERTPSLHYYKKDNRVYCFGGCGKGGDAIAVYRQINNCSFLEAIKALTP